MSRITVIIVPLALSFLLGWKASGWQRDSVELMIKRTASQTGAQLQTIASESARKLEVKLDAIRNAPPKEINLELGRPVFNIDCLSGEYVGMYNTAAENAERALSGKFKGEVSDHVTETDRH